MPRNVRNFWLDLFVDGRKNSVKTGPRQKDGGFLLTIYQRDRGCVSKGITISGVRNPITDTLTIRVEDDTAGMEVYRKNTKR